MKAESFPFDWRALALSTELALRRWGPVRVLALGMLGLGTLLLLLLMLRSAAAEAPLRERLATRQQALRQALAAARPSPRDATGLGPLMAALGEGDRVEQYVQQVFNTAHAGGIHLGSGEYRWQRDARAETDRYQLRLPVKGPYADVRAFAEQVLADLPFASLDEFSLKRDSIEQEVVEAQLLFSFHLHASAAGQAALKEGHAS
ncbi:MAG: hypothetical protein JO006_19065 [Paucibacter sp.]|nr:hypothetical protein [Roseateles sp.]